MGNQTWRQSMRVGWSNSITIDAGCVVLRMHANLTSHQVTEQRHPGLLTAKIAQLSLIGAASQFQPHDLQPRPKPQSSLLVIDIIPERGRRRRPRALRNCSTLRRCLFTTIIPGEHPAYPSQLEEIILPTKTHQCGIIINCSSQSWILPSRRAALISTSPRVDQWHSCISSTGHTACTGIACRRSNIFLQPGHLHEHATSNAVGPRDNSAEQVTDCEAAVFADSIIWLRAALKRRPQLHGRILATPSLNR